MSTAQHTKSEHNDRLRSMLGSVGEGGDAITEMVTGDGSGVELRMLQEEEMCLEEKWESRIANARYWFYRSDLLEPALRVYVDKTKREKGKKDKRGFMLRA